MENDNLINSAAHCVDAVLSRNTAKLSDKDRDLLNDDAFAADVLEISDIVCDVNKGLNKKSGIRKLFFTVSAAAAIAAVIFTLTFFLNPDPSNISVSVDRPHKSSVSVASAGALTVDKDESSNIYSKNDVYENLCEGADNITLKVKHKNLATLQWQTDITGPYNVELSTNAGKCLFSCSTCKKVLLMQKPLDKGLYYWTIKSSDNSLISCGRLIVEP